MSVPKRCRRRVLGYTLCSLLLLGASAFTPPSPLWRRSGASPEFPRRRLASVSAASSQSPDKAALMELPKPLTPIERAARSVTFWSRVVPILANYALVQRRLDKVKEEEGSIDPAVAHRMWEEAHDWGSKRLSDTIMELKGFYVKSGQVMSSRVDVFPQQYIERLQKLQDSLEPIPFEVVTTVVRQELLEGEPLDLLFKEFDPVPLGSASIAQVHRAVLVDGRRVAVKVQRPSEEPKLRADVANLKLFAQRFRGVLPVDFYPVFSELEKALTNELDFLAEAQAIEKIAASVAHTADGEIAESSVMVPRAIPGLVSKRVLVMDFIDGVPLNRLKEKMAERNITEGSPESIIFGTRLLGSLTESFARMAFGPGFIHGDPHPGNIFICEGGKVALLDCGQVKQLSNTQKLRLAGLILLCARWGKPDGPTAAQLTEKVREFGVEFEEGAGEACGAAVALLLFGETGAPLPGGYSTVELSAESPLKKIKQFPQELVMFGRATVLLKGIAGRLKVKWNLAERFAEAAQQAIECGDEGCSLPVYATVALPKLGKAGSDMLAPRPKFAEVRVAFRELRTLLKAWLVGKVGDSMPAAAKTWFIERELRKIQRLEDEIEGEMAQQVLAAQGTPLATPPQVAPPVTSLAVDEIRAHAEEEMSEMSELRDSSAEEAEASGHAEAPPLDPPDAVLQALVVPPPEPVPQPLEGTSAA